MPLAKKRPRYDDEDPLGAFGKQLGNNKARFDGLAKANLVGENAAAFGNAAKGEHDRVDLVGIRIDLATPLGAHVTTAFSGTAQPHEILCVVASVDGVCRSRIQAHGS